PAHGSGIVCVRVPAADAAFTALQRAGVQCALREGVLRFAPHLYNGVDDVERVIEVLDSVAHG
ncbi:MAG: aminotransferase class V-fold PLP-dependent enzyme, partial [Longimicrobiales bacterium]